MFNKSGIDASTFEECVLAVHEKRFTKDGGPVRYSITHMGTGHGSDVHYCSHLTDAVIEKLIEKHPEIAGILRKK